MAVCSGVASAALAAGGTDSARPVAHFIRRYPVTLFRPTSDLIQRIRLEGLLDIQLRQEATATAEAGWLG